MNPHKQCPYICHDEFSYCLNPDQGCFYLGAIWQDLHLCMLPPIEFLEYQASLVLTQNKLTNPITKEEERP